MKKRGEALEGKCGIRHLSNDTAARAPAPAGHARIRARGGYALKNQVIAGQIVTHDLHGGYYYNPGRSPKIGK